MSRRGRCRELAVLALATLAGCGSGGAERDAAGVLERFQDAAARGDGAAACEQLAEETRSELEKQEAKPCDEAVLGLGLSRARVSRTVVDVTSAAVDLAGGGRAYLDKTPRGWKVSAAACRPQPGRPWDCELKD